MMLCVALGIQEGLSGRNMKWFKEKLNNGTVTENDEYKLCWDFEYYLCKTTSARRPDVPIEYKNKNKMFLIDMACPSKNSVDAKHVEKLQKYQQHKFQMKERRPGNNAMLIPIVNGCSGRGMRWATDQVGRLISDEKKRRAISKEMVKRVLFESENITRRVLPGLIQEERLKYIWFPVHWFSSLSLISVQFVKFSIVNSIDLTRFLSWHSSFNLRVLSHLIHATNFLYVSLNIFHTIDKNM